jgi:tRNA G18 (ribose-2'-O)-methylase SpoU
MGGTPLPDFVHPERAVYILGAEDGGLPIEIAARCHGVVSIPAVRFASYNVAVAGTLIMYDRMIKHGR